MSSEPATDIRPDRRSPTRRPPRGAATAIVFAVALTALVGTGLAAWLDDDSLGLRASVLAAGGGSVLLSVVLRQHGVAVFGVANTVTLVRAALVVLLAALLGTAPTPALGWVVVALGTAGIALDGVDGALARRRNEASAFGARFDMETDALLILVLAALVWQHGKAGPWILAAGLLRYLFVAASWALPWFGAALPPSRRRQAVCVIQIVSLLGALAPIVVLPWSAALALAGLAALVWSFAIDVLWLARHARS